MENNQIIARKIIEQVQKTGLPQVEVFISFQDVDKITVRRSTVTDIKKSGNIGYAVRIIEAGKVGFAYSTDITMQGVRQTVEKAVSGVAFSDPDKDLRLPGFTRQTFSGDLQTFDRSILDLSMEQKVQIAKRIEEAAYQKDKRINNTEEVGISCGVSETVLWSTHIPLLSQRSTFIGGYAEVIAQEDMQKEAGSYYHYVTRQKDFSAVYIGEQAAARAVYLLNTRPAKTQSIDLVFDPSVSTQFLSVIMPMLSAENVYKGKSLLKDKEGQKIASPDITIIDDAFLPGGLGSALYDDEGVPTAATVLVENGILKNYLFDSKNARRLGTVSTGNSFRSSYRSQPGILSSNTYIKPGEAPIEDFISGLKQGIYIFEIMGLHMANPISGEFSLGAQGIMIENGERTHSVRGITIAGNTTEVLKKIDYVGSDLTFFAAAGNLGAPSLGIRQIMVGGEL